MKLTASVIIVLSLFLAACANNEQRIEEHYEQSTCTQQEMQFITSSFDTSDGRGHGPDIGSAEWQSVIEFHLGLRGSTKIPDRESAQWCQFIIEQIKAPTTHYSPSFDCSDKQLSSIEQLVCSAQELALLDAKLADVYAVAKTKSGNFLATLKAQQRGWLKGRNECWKATNKKNCVELAYQRRIAELQARYQLVSATMPAFYQCDNNPANEVVVTWYETLPKTLIAERGYNVSLMYAVPSASGSKYAGQNEMLWQHQGQIQLVWGYNAAPIVCELK